MRVLLITGGRHKFYETTPIVARFLRSAGHVVRVTRAARELSRPSVRAYDAIILNTVRGTKEKGPYKIPDSELDNDFDATQKEALRAFVSTGGGLLSLHVSPTSCPGWAEMLKITGGGWISQPSTSFGFNVMQDIAGLRGQLQVRARGGKNRFHSTSVLTLTASGNAGTWTGTGRWDGVAGYTFTVSVVDTVEPPRPPLPAM